MITNQAYLFLVFTINGMLIGILFDFFRILRRSFKTSDFITYLEDIIFWILTGLSLLYSIFVFNNGEIRLFMFLAIAIGIVIYMLLFSSYIIKVNVIIITFLKKIISKIFSFLIFPFRYLYGLLKKLFVKPFSFITINMGKFSTSFYKKIIQLTKNYKKIENNVKN